jgi:hypothetical protein
MEAEREQEGLMAATQDAIDATSTAYAEDAHLTTTGSGSSPTTSDPDTR